MELNDQYWENRYQKSDTGWDIGYISTPLKDYFDTLTDSSMRILIPGCGKAYEAEYLHKKGFTNVWVADYAPSAIEAFKSRMPEFPADHLLVSDFFKLNGPFDLIVEQTFFCALDRSLRSAYVNKMVELLSDGGSLVGLLFNDFENAVEPPFGGNELEYRTLFGSLFSEISIEPCLNSIEKRMGRELFFKCRKTPKIA